MKYEINTILYYRYPLHVSSLKALDTYLKNKKVLMQVHCSRIIIRIFIQTIQGKTK